MLLKKGKEHEVRIRLSAPVKLVPYHTKGQPPSYFIIAGLVFTQVCAGAMWGVRLAQLGRSVLDLQGSRSQCTSVHMAWQQRPRNIALPQLLQQRSDTEIGHALPGDSAVPAL